MQGMRSERIHRMYAASSSQPTGVPYMQLQRVALVRMRRTQVRMALASIWYFDEAHGLKWM